MPQQLRSIFALPNDGNPSGLGAYWSAFTSDPVGAAQFALGFLGSPFFYVVSYPLAELQWAFLLIAGAGYAPRPILWADLSAYPIAFAIGFYTAQAAGVVLIVATTILARRWLASGREATRGALLTFLVFIAISAAASAAGRLHYGVKNAFQVRYLTAPLLAWIALIVFGAPSLNLSRALGIFACAVVLLLPSQLLPVFWTQGRSSSA